MIFLDTSIFVAAAQTRHIHHKPSAKLLKQASHKDAAASLHSLAETYNVLSGMPPPFRLPPMAVVRIIEQMRARVRLISLTETEYASTIERIAGQGLTGGMVYDALLMRCARKAGATRIYSWNARHFKLIDPELAGIVYFP
jgi:predicted nucleic acid-binding protein